MQGGSKEEAGLGTRSVWAGDDGEHWENATQVPIALSAAFGFEDLDTWLHVAQGRARGHIYSRNTNPTVAAFEEKIKNLEAADAAASFSSGMAAISNTLFTLLSPGDRVVSMANHADAGLTNGEVGTVVGRAEGGLQVAFAAPVTVPDRFLGDLRHGWALTVHRAQGSEWPAVVAVFPAEAADMLSRPLVYTALTRARRHLSVVHGAGPALARAVSAVGEPPRVTRLAGLLAGM